MVLSFVFSYVLWHRVIHFLLFFGYPFAVLTESKTTRTGPAPENNTDKSSTNAGVEDRVTLCG